MPTSLELLLTRRSVSPRLLVQPAPTPVETALLLTAAARVPDHGRVVPWRFVVIDPGGAARLGEFIASTFLTDNPGASPEAVETERHRLTRAPLVIAVVSSPREHPKAPEWEQILSAGAAAMTTVVAANAMGYASNWHTGWYAYDRRVTGELGLASQERIAGFIHIGTAAETPAERQRPALGDVVTVYGGDGIGIYAEPDTGSAQPASPPPSSDPRNS